MLTHYSSVLNRSPRSLVYFWVFQPALVSYCEPGRGSEASWVRFPLAPNLDALRCAAFQGPVQDENSAKWPRLM